MRPLTEHCAKPLLHFRGERLIERHLRQLAAAGFERVIINCSWHGQLLRTLLGDGSAYGLQIRYSCEGDTPIETASGIARAAELLGNEPFLLLNGDIWTDLPLAPLRSLQLVDNPPHNPTGDFSLVNDLASNGDSERLTYAGIAVLSADFVARDASSGAKFGDTLRRAADTQQLMAKHHTGAWFDIGTPAAIRQ